jgi:hypothetical protein
LREQRSHPRGVDKSNLEEKGEKERERKRE